MTADPDTTSGPRAHGGFIRVVGGLTLINIAAGLQGLITGPLQARALGPSGRGDLAAIVVPTTTAAFIFSLSLGAYAARQAALGRRTDELAGSLGAILVVVGVFGAAGGVLLAGPLARGREVVELFLIIGFALLPLALVTGLLSSIAGGLNMWRELIAARMIPVATALLGIITLYVIGELTVTSAAIVTLSGSLLSIVPLARLVRRIGRWRVSRSIAREGLGFGLRTWVGNMASMANNRVDQLIMVPAVAPRELGLYAVAVTLSGIPGYLAGALQAPLLTRITEGDRGIVARTLRTTLLLSLLIGVVMALITPVGLPLLFGDDFSEAVIMSLILFAAAVPLAGVHVSSTALIAGGRPGTTSVGEMVALAVTGVGLVLLLGPYGGLGAAITSLIAYCLNFSIQIAVLRNVFGGSVWSYIAPRRADLPSLVSSVRRAR